MFAKGAGPILTTKEKKIVENVFTTYLEDGREQRETTYIYRTLIRDSLYGDQYSVPLPQIQVKEIKQLHLLTLFVTLYLYTQDF